MADNFSLPNTLPETGCTREDIYDLLKTANPTEAVVNTAALAVSSNKITAGARLPYFRKVTKSHADLAVAALTNDIELLQLPAGGLLHGLKIKCSEAFGGSGIATYKLSIKNHLEPEYLVRELNAAAAVGSTNQRVVWAPCWDDITPAAFVNTDGAIGALALTAPAAFVNTDGAIGGLTLGGGYSQAEVQALRNACEVLADDCRALRTTVAAYQSTLTTLIAALETLADDSRALRGTLAKLFAGTRGAADHTTATSIRMLATATGANLNAATAGSVDVWALYSQAI
jgi:hypothetical protein